MLGSTAREAARRFGERPVLVHPDGTLTYADLDRGADALAAGLRSLGVRGGDVVAAVLPSGAEWMLLAVALDRVGAVLATVSAKLAPPERAELVRLVDPALVVAGPDLVDGLPLRTAVSVLEPWGLGSELAADPTTAPPRPGGGPGDGGPRAHHDDLLHLGHDRPCQGCGVPGAPPAGRPGPGPGARGRRTAGAAASPMIASTQFAHVGMALKLPWYLRLGATLHVLEPWRADDALRLVADERMPAIGVVAPQLALMLRSPLMDTLDLSSVTSIIAGGAASPRRSWPRPASASVPATPSATPRPSRAAWAWGRTPAPRTRKRCTPSVGPDRAWRPVSRTSRTARSPTARWASSSSAPPPSWTATGTTPTATAAALAPDRWLRTGDLARVDGSGCFVLAGRRTDMFIRGGYNVFPLEVEAVLADHPDVAGVAVAPRPDQVMGEVGVAVVVPADPGRPPTLASLRDHAGGRLARHKLPEDLVVVDRLPLTTVSKVDRAALADLVGDRPDRPEGGAG